MSKVRISVEWDICGIKLFFISSAVGKMYVVCALVRNAHTCLYGSVTSPFFDLDPPILTNYFQ